MRFLQQLLSTLVFLVAGVSCVVFFGFFLITLQDSLLPQSSLGTANTNPPPTTAAASDAFVATTSATVFYEKAAEIITSSTTPESGPGSTTEPEPAPDSSAEYIVVVDSCGTAFDGECLNARSGPDTEYPSVAKLRTGTVLKVKEAVENDGQHWYHVVFDEWLRYPERVRGKWYVAAAHVEPIRDPGTLDRIDPTATTTKRILVDRSEQRLYAYDGDNLFMETAISTGLELTPTPRGTFTIYKKTPSRYMQGPLPYLAISKYYDLPGVPWNLYFTQEGAVIHGAYWHKSFGRPYSSGCVNMQPDEARALYTWADLGTPVTVRD